MKRFMAIIMSIVVAITCIISIRKSDNIIQASAFHIDFWNYEMNCMVVYDYVAYNSYMVVVQSSDGHTIWTNNVDYIRWWYSESQLTEMLGYQPEYGAYMVITDVKKELINNTTFFARLSM